MEAAALKSSSLSAGSSCFLPNEVLMTQFNYFLSKLIFLICGLRPSQPSNPIEILFFIGLNFFSSIIMLLILGFISLHLSRPGVSLSKIELASI